MQLFFYLFDVLVEQACLLVLDGGVLVLVKPRVVANIFPCSAHPGDLDIDKRIILSRFCCSFEFNRFWFHHF